MIKLINALKELIVAVQFGVAKLKNRIFGYNEAMQRLYSDGLFLRKQVLSQKQTEEIRAEIDRLLSTGDVNIWRDELCSDERIYGVDAISDLIKASLPVEEFRSIGEKYLNKSLKYHFILSGRLTFAEGNLGSGGGWHRDSPFSHQFKAITYLTDVNADNGPFQYISGSHLSLNKAKLNFSLNQYRYKNAEVEGLLSSNRDLELVECVGKAGDACLVDTKVIHRGKPIDQGRRYSLTIYFFETAKQLRDFKSLLQK